MQSRIIEHILKSDLYNQSPWSKKCCDSESANNQKNIGDPSICEGWPQFKFNYYQDTISYLP